MIKGDVPFKIEVVEAKLKAVAHSLTVFIYLFIILNGFNQCLLLQIKDFS